MGTLGGSELQKTLCTSTYPLCLLPQAAKAYMVLKLAIKAVKIRIFGYISTVESDVYYASLARATPGAAA